jgi:hypothetical protein
MLVKYHKLFKLFVFSLIMHFVLECVSVREVVRKGSKCAVIVAEDLFACDIMRIHYILFLPTRSNFSCYQCTFRSCGCPENVNTLKL